MLIEDFYKVENTEVAEDEIIAHIELNKTHQVYKGHFPGQAVVPGVIQLQIIKEIFEDGLQEKFQLHYVVFAKYLRLITPETSGQLDIIIRHKKTGEDVYQINALIGSGDIVFTKLKADYIKIS